MVGITRRPTLFDIDYLARNARQADKDEALLFAGKTIWEALNETKDIFDNSFVWEVDGRLVCMYGVTPVSDKVGVIWFLATDEFDNYKDFVKKHCKKVCNILLMGYDHVYNYVYVGHDKALRWVKWLGFTVHEPAPVGIKGDLFCKFEVVKNV